MSIPERVWRSTFSQVAAPWRLLPTVRDYQKWLCASATPLDEEAKKEVQEKEEMAEEEEEEEKKKRRYGGKKKTTGGRGGRSVIVHLRITVPPTEGAIPDHLVSPEEGQVT